MRRIRQIMSGLAYVEMKADRAKRHLDELTELVQQVVQDAYTITRQDRPKQKRHIVTFEFKAMPESIPFLAGEFAYALRSGLDQLAWQLAFLNTSPRHPRTHTSFPVRSEPLKPPRTFATLDAVRDIIPDAIPIIESLQPFQRGHGAKSHPLYLLNELCIIDKHMILPIKASDARIDIEGAHFTRRRELPFGFELHYDLRDKYKIQVNTIRTELLFGEPLDSFGNLGMTMRIADFANVYDFVRNEVIRRLASFFQ
jgi:hypothetical protein